ncbi:hypothetical protein RWE15_11380 [Virgibacillus halophilus]|uniref:Uncharacterized protein n=1 Tax=Tigheibacillus halophilus TaxID=361280 RepID=A0ABU5C6S8_9BACI|nr:hypothetical protein [Virgibacillus halophilus]
MSILREDDLNGVLFNAPIGLFVTASTFICYFTSVSVLLIVLLTLLIVIYIFIVTSICTIVEHVAASRIK